MEMVRLRPEVIVNELGEETSVSFAHWQVSLPTSAVAIDHELRSLLSGGAIDIAPASVSSRGILQLLNAQGCFLAELPKTLTARQALKLFQPLRSFLYAQYYSHPLWQRIRNGLASKGELAAWMIHNYHVSRSAGVIAARAGSFSRDDDTRAFFQKDSLEEYWHCESFYFVKQASIELLADEVKSYIPLPASTGFEEHALRTAEEDPLAHLLIAYFQESSIMFRQDAEKFYSDVESNYEIGGAFSGWRKHMTLDLDHDHAGELEARFDNSASIAASSVRASIRKAHYAQFFLLKALDQIAEFGSSNDGVSERQPANERAARTLEIRLDDLHVEFLLHSLRDAAFRSLAFARSHDQIIAVGRLASKLDNALSEISRREETGPWSLACRSFLFERSIDPERFMPLALWLIDQIAADLPRFRELTQSTSVFTSNTSEPNSVERFRLIELLRLLPTDAAFVHLSLSASP